MFLIGIIVANVPEGLLATVTVSTRFAILFCGAFRSPSRLNLESNSGVPHFDGQAHGSQELSGQELGSCRDPGIDFDHLLRQNRNLDPEPHDGRPHVVRPADRGSGYHRGSIR